MTEQHPITPPPELAQTPWSEMVEAHYKGINQHPISVPDELLRQWCNRITSRAQTSEELWRNIANTAAQWAADAELEACCEWFQEFYKTESWVTHDLKHFRDARRPKPPSKAESALNALEHILRHSQTDHGANTIRLALEHLKKLEEATND